MGVSARKPRPSIRVFALFARRDVLVLTHAVPRGELADRKDPAWSTEIRRARHLWRQLLPHVPPMTGGNIGDIYRNLPHQPGWPAPARRRALATLEPF
jgi:hypothetical protein